MRDKYGDGDEEGDGWLDITRDRQITVDYSQYLAGLLLRTMHGMVMVPRPTFERPRTSPSINTSESPGDTLLTLVVGRGDVSALSRGGSRLTSTVTLVVNFALVAHQVALPCPGLPWPALTFETFNKSDMAGGLAGSNGR